MELFTSAWDGDVEGVLQSLESGVSVNVTRHVSVYTTLSSNKSIRNGKMFNYEYIPCLLEK